MDKLVKLLNEYNGEDTFWIDECDDSNGNCSCFICRGDGTECFVDEHIISKKFGFIKWLYDNEKMKLESIKNTDMYWDLCEWVGPVENVIMHLSISDTPIDDLIKLLK